MYNYIYLIMFPFKVAFKLIGKNLTEIDVIGNCKMIFTFDADDFPLYKVRKIGHYLELFLMTWSIRFWAHFHKPTREL